MNENLNRFQRNEAIRAAQRTSTHGLSRAEAEARRDKQHTSWTQHGRTQAPGSLILDQRTLAAKAAAIADRNRPASAAPTVMTEKSIAAIVERWVQETGFYASEFNSLSLNHRLREQVDAGASFSYELLNEAHEFLRRNNHLEKPATTVRKRGEIVGAAVPVLYLYVPLAEQQAIDADRAAKAVDDRANEDAENRNLSFDDLRRRVAAERGIISREKIMVHQG
jgi:hypothetical protein